MVRKMLGLILFAAVCGTMASAANVQTLWLDTLDYSGVTIGWGHVNANKSVDDNPLTINDQKFDRGVGTHALSEFVFQLDGKAVRFSALVGVDSEIASSPNGRDRASVEFVVLGDNKELFNSGVMKAGMAAKPVDVDLKGVKRLRLIASEGGNGIDYDHADWVMARIDYTGKTPVLAEPVRAEPYILTPKPGPAPRITGARIFGARPGNPFLFTVTATGDRPMMFSVEGLPKGLTLDEMTGQITGVVETAGEYKTTVTAKNKAGQASRELKIVIGNKIALTPPMGWNSWNCWACAVDDTKVRQSAKAMADSGLINHGWSYINIDDCWMRKPNSDDPIVGGPVRDQDGRILCN